MSKAPKAAPAQPAAANAPAQDATDGQAPAGAVGQLAPASGDAPARPVPDESHLIEVAKAGEENLLVHPDALRQHMNLGWEVI